jgi:hypothetical protein
VTALIAVAVIVAVMVVALAIYYLVRSRPALTIAAAPDDFADLNEEERCDYVFALSALDDPANVALLRRAMDDPSDVVAIAAARSLVLAGRCDEVDAMLARRQDARSQQIASALELLA